MHPDLAFQAISAVRYTTVLIFRVNYTFVNKLLSGLYEKKFWDCYWRLQVPSIHCPICRKEIAFDAIQCPCCLSVLRRDSFWITFKKNAQSKSFWTMVLWPLLIFPFIPQEQFPVSFFWRFTIAFVVSLIIFLSVTRPKNIQPTTLISFFALLMSLGAFVYLAIGTLDQRRDFELRTRPYISIEGLPKIELPGTFRPAESGPEIKFLITLMFGNHGVNPASITDVQVRASKSLLDVKSKSAIVLGPYIADQKSNWKNIDLFPYVEGLEGHEIGLERKFFLSIDDMNKLFGLNMVVVKNIHIDDLKKQNIETSNSSRTEENKFIKAINESEFYLLVYLTYRGLYNTNTENVPYYYWIIYQHKSKKFVPVESGTKQLWER